MRVLVAPDCFTGTLSAPEAADAIARGWLRAAPADDVVRLPLADGGPGFLQALHCALGGDLEPVTVTGPLGDPVPAAMLLVRREGRTTAYVEAAHAAGLDLVPAERRDPSRTSSIGVGELVRASLGAGATRVVVGVGGTATNDGGAGLLAGLGVGAADGALRRGGGALEAVTEDDLAGLGEIARELAGIDLVAALDVDVPLLGLHGASAGFAAQKGASPEQAQHLERCLGHFAHLAQRVLVAEGPPRARPLPLASGPDRGLALDGLVDEHAGHSHAGHSHGTSGDSRLAALPGAGAGGGLGFGLALLGARLVTGARVVADAVGLGDRIAEVDLVVTGEGRFDWQSLRGKVAATVAETALSRGVPTVLLAGQVEMGRREWSSAGFSGVYAVAETPLDVPAALADPVGTLEARAQRLGKTWSH